ncbi:unnamed protein product [Allacma fusca]|uniref:Uncharacterized protein n=1 Tax=Allacma fusca TaxID=39272 RepID=A0A8J2PV42_9HEXA|nr:unnamed protein product [Allacma fusca]
MTRSKYFSQVLCSSHNPEDHPEPIRGSHMHVHRICDVSPNGGILNTSTQEYIPKFLDVQLLTNKLEQLSLEVKPEHLVTIGTIGTLYILYKNYCYILKVKERRKSFSGNTLIKCGSAYGDSKNLNKDRNILQKIWHLGGLFDSLRSLDRILEVLWIPSVERGLRFRFGYDVPESLRTPVWHYGDVYDAAEMVLKSTKKERDGQGLPDHILYLLKFARIFGHYFLQDILLLNDHVIHLQLKKDEVLFDVGGPDDKAYITISGAIEITFKDEEGIKHLLRTFRAGEQLLSLLSFIDFMIGKRRAFRVIKAKATEDSEVMILGLTQELIAHTPRMPLKNLDHLPALTKPPKEIVDAAGNELLKELNLSDRSLLSDCSVLVVPPDFVIYEAGVEDNKSVVFVYEGELQVSLKSYIVTSQHEGAFYVNAREIFGALVFLTDDARLFTAKTTTKSIIVIIPSVTLKNLMDNYPTIFFPLVNSIFSRLSNFARRMDFGLEWTYFQSGQVVFYVDDESTAVHLVLSGRLRAYLAQSEDVVADARSVIGEYGKYDFVGLTEVWSKRRRTKTVLAVRDTELAKIPDDFLTYVCSRYAKVSYMIIQFLTKKVVSTYRTRAESTGDIFNMDDLKVDKKSSRSTIALFPASSDVPITYIAKEFESYYSKFGSILTITPGYVRDNFSADAFVPGARSGLTAWLGYLESKYMKILYIADCTSTPWSTKCFHQADMIFIAVNNDGRKDISPVEGMILAGSSLARKELLICHKYSDGFPKKMPRYTKGWLEKRPWLNFHHHVYIHSDFYKLSNEELQGLDKQNLGRNEDLTRVMRWLTGHTFGLALGGGGAKGAAHIGFLREFERIKLPIDMICGVSIGSFIGALLAVYQDLDKVEFLARNWFTQTSNPKKFFLDLTIPYVSLFTGESLNISLIELFGDVQIEDLHIPFFTCTTDLSNNSIREHRCGSLWRYVRASMTLINVFPPICDPRDGHYLIDGGYTNLVPADMMRKLGVRYIMAVDISSKANHYRNTNYGDAISGLNVFSHMAPVLSTVSVPSIFEIQSRLTWAQSVVYLKLVKKMEHIDASENSPSVAYIRLPIDFYSTSDFKRFEKILGIGSSFGTRVFENISPGDSVDVVWLKLKLNKASHRLGFGVDCYYKNTGGSFVSTILDQNSMVTNGVKCGDSGSGIGGSDRVSLDLSDSIIQDYGSQLGI